MEFVSENINIKIDGVAYSLSRPKVKSIRKLSKNQDEISIDSVIDLVGSCGLPESVIDELSADNLNKIVEVLMGKNQKK